MRLTVAVVQQLLDQNDGFKDTTSTSQKNFSETRHYRIADGQLYYDASGKTSWADSRYSHKDQVATIDQTRNFLRPRLHRLNTDGIE
ncbi:hypothetical protein OG612_45400 (plasmid) [Streptomyces sp. NBC_01527]|uniref:hypothetical protein n=1 Tax=Streptomyces sp. NBC_01527 TaxID=2903894 RepID=UPI002F909167